MISHLNQYIIDALAHWLYFYTCTYKYRKNDKQILQNKILLIFKAVNGMASAYLCELITSLLTNQINL